MKRLILIHLISVLLLNSYAQDSQNVTSYIANPSFESATSDWTLTNLSRQSNSEFSKKAGTYYLEKWTNRGTTVGSASARLMLTSLPPAANCATAAAGVALED